MIYVWIRPGIDGSNRSVQIYCLVWLSLGQGASDLCSYAVEKSKLGNSSPYIAQHANCWKGYEGWINVPSKTNWHKRPNFSVHGSLYKGDCWRGGTCESTCGIGGYCCSKIKLKDNFDCPSGTGCDAILSVQ